MKEGHYGPCSKDKLPAESSLYLGVYGYKLSYKVATVFRYS